VLDQVVVVASDLESLLHWSLF